MSKIAMRKEAIRERKKIRAARKQEQQDEREERIYIRWLLFCKGRGMDKNLNQNTDSVTVNHHVHRAYDKYLLALQQGIDTRTDKVHPLTGSPAHPWSFKKYRIHWYGAAKMHYIKYDVPALMRMKWSQLHASGNTEVPQQPAGKWLSLLQREINERGSGDLGVSVSELPGGVRRDQRRHSGQIKVRERRETPARTNRFTETLGDA